MDTEKKGFGGNETIIPEDCGAGQIFQDKQEGSRYHVRDSRQNQE